MGMVEAIRSEALAALPAVEPSDIAILEESWESRGPICSENVLGCTGGATFASDWFRPGLAESGRFSVIIAEQTATPPGQLSA